MGEMEGMGKRVTLVHQEVREKREWLVLMGQLGRKVHEETQVHRVTQVCEGTKVLRESQDC